MLYLHRWMPLTSYNSPPNDVNWGKAFGDRLDILWVVVVVVVVIMMAGHHDLGHEGP